MSLVNNEKELEQLLVECQLSTKLFCQVFFPSIFHRKFSALHEEIFEVLDDDAAQLVAISAPRGIGKTSLMSLAFPAKRILFRESEYVVPISATESLAIELGENLKSELVNNEVVRELFGEIKSKEFAKQGWQSSTGAKVLPRGAGQQVRGRVQRSRSGALVRPDLFVIDDLESDEGVESEDRREKLQRWLFSAVLNSVDRGSNKWRILVIGTILHEDSLLSNLLTYPGWTSVRLDLCDDNYHSSWPEFMSDEEVKALAASYREKGLLDVFYREYRGLPIALESRGFKPEYFQSYKRSESKLNLDADIVSVVLADPAKTHKTGSANTAVVGVSVDVNTNALYVREVVEGQFYPGELYDEMIDMANRINALILAPEVTSLNEYITYPLANRVSERGQYFITVEVKPRESKTGPKRSAGLIPMYRSGQVYHRAGACGGLEKYLMQWPRPSKWDVIDALSGILFVLEDGEVYFSPREDSDEERVFNEIEYEESFTGFRVI